MPARLTITHMMATAIGPSPPIAILRRKGRVACAFQSATAGNPNKTKKQKRRENLLYTMPLAGDSGYLKAKSLDRVARPGR